ncbi:MAG: hypothetical protein JW900_01815 [Anaerolineae bacterium]|nr:hypothetical protein [Anaerolineae bacterium]
MRYADTPLAEDPIGSFISLTPLENPDWGFARNRRCALMAPSAEWVQSIYSSIIEIDDKRLIAPNRDYPYEGLLVYQGGENWKFIDCVALGLQDPAGKYLPFVTDRTRLAVRLNPWRVTYEYKIAAAALGGREGAEIPFYVSYYLHSRNQPLCITGCVELYFPHGLVHHGTAITPVLQPFLDIRHMYDPSRFDYEIQVNDSASYRNIQFRHGQRSITFRLPPVELDRFAKPQQLEWHYKLGTGEREESPDGKTVFEEEHHDIAAFFQVRIPPSFASRWARLFFCCNLHEEEKKAAFPSFPVLEEQLQQSRGEDWRLYQRLQQLFPLRPGIPFQDAILGRIAGLTKFKLYIHLAQPPIFYVQVPYAGAWWFKNPWYRDVFEGILNSMDTLMRIPEERENIKNIILLALCMQDEASGRILNRLPQFNKEDNEDYNTSDATLLCFIAANAYVQRTGDVDFAWDLLPYAIKMVERFCRQDALAHPLYKKDGPPQVDAPTGLLLSVPRHSWIDTQTQSVFCEGRLIENLPNRVSESFIHALYERLADDRALKEHLSAPEFFLPEINAQWIVMLQGMLETIRLALSREPLPAQAGPEIAAFRERVADLLARATAHFKAVFWDPERGFLYNVVYRERSVRDPLPTEPAVVAAAMLGEMIFAPAELSAIWERIRQELLVHRRLVKYGIGRWPFGIVARGVSPQIYYGDHQYHADVVWLRSTPYLIKLLQMLGEDELVEQILINTLDHQMTEGAIFYNHELLARPRGSNPYPDQQTHDNPVPVKEPIQFWSQWCDPLVEVFGKGAS